MRFNSQKHHLPPCPVSGILLVDKPKDWTSFDVVNMVRSRFNVPKVGHCGTLDPAATGLLVLVLGKFTSYSGKLSGDDKIYEAKLQLGLMTDTGDLSGTEQEKHDISDLTEEKVHDVIRSFLGKQMQVPPMHSAVKVDGHKLYELARKGIKIEREPREIMIYTIDITSMTLPFCDFVVRCSKGTYVRTLCEDIGKKLGCGGVLAGLRRIRSGKFSIADAVTVDELKAVDQEGFCRIAADQLTKLAEKMR